MSRIDQSAVLTAQRMWVQGFNTLDIAAACGMSQDWVYRTARRCAFPARVRGSSGGPRVTVELPFDELLDRIEDVWTRRAADGFPYVPRDQRPYVGYADGGAA